MKHTVTLFTQSLSITMLKQQLFYTLKEADLLQAAEFCIDLQHLYRFGTVPSTEYNFLWAKN